MKEIVKSEWGCAMMGRINHMIPFIPFEELHQKMIIFKFLNEYKNYLKNKKNSLKIMEDTPHNINIRFAIPINHQEEDNIFDMFTINYDTNDGRSLRKSVEEVEQYITHKWIYDEISPGDNIKLTYIDDELTHIKL